MPKSELLLQLFELKGEGGGGECPACLYVYFRTFFKCKSCTFLGSSEFLFVFGFFFFSEHFAVSFFYI